MSLAIGFVCQEGILLCAEKETNVGGLGKIYRPKVHIVESPFGKAVFATAGHMDYAQSAIDVCREKLNRINSDSKASLSSVIREVLSKEYQKRVMQTPADVRVSLDYAFVIGIQSSTMEQPELHVTNKCSLRRVDGYDCIGAGAYLCQYIIGQSFLAQVPTRADAFLAAIYCIDKVKTYVPDCGGTTEAGFLYPDGHFESLSSVDIRQAEKHFQDFDREVALLRHQFSSAKLSFPNFKRHLKQFSDTVANLRKQWDVENERIISQMQAFGIPPGRSFTMPDHE